MCEIYNKQTKDFLDYYHINYNDIIDTYSMREFASDIDYMRLIIKCEFDINLTHIEVFTIWKKFCEDCDAIWINIGRGYKIIQIIKDIISKYSFNEKEI